MTGARPRAGTRAGAGDRGGNPYREPSCDGRWDLRRDLRGVSAVTCAGLVLAAGRGARYGMPKALVPLEGELLVERAVRMLAEGGCDPVLVVLGAQAEQVRAAATLPTTVVAPDWETGMGASLRTGLTALADGDAAACVVALVDQPLIGSAAVSRLRAAWAEGAVAAVATYGGAPRNPVLLARTVWSDVAASAEGDAGARTWLRGHADRVTLVPCDDTGSAYDVDTPEDLAALPHSQPRSVHTA